MWVRVLCILFVKWGMMHFLSSVILTVQGPSHRCPECNRAVVLSIPVANSGDPQKAVCFLCFSGMVASALPSPDDIASGRASRAIFGPYDLWGDGGTGFKNTRHAQRPTFGKHISVQSGKEGYEYLPSGGSSSLQPSSSQHASQHGGSRNANGGGRPSSAAPSGSGCVDFVVTAPCVSGKPQPRKNGNSIVRFYYYPKGGTQQVHFSRYL